MTIAPPTTIQRKRYISPSLRSGLRISAPYPSLEDVDRRENDDPHHVDEVPVDPADLDAVMVLGGEMPAEGADRHEQEDREPDEDVATVEAGQAEKDRWERAVLRREAGPHVLVELREKEREAHEEREQ